MLEAVQFEIQEVLFGFMRALDNKDWEKVLDYLLNSVYTDYSSFRPESPGFITKSDYVASRQQAHGELKIQHNLFNLLITPAQDLAEVICNYAIFRFHPQFNGAKKDFFHSYGNYKFELRRERDVWKIASIVQNLLVNDGNPELHGALRRSQ
jgi:3-phenylpropionate/cinnamic acid dioxygenase small subunit